MYLYEEMIPLSLSSEYQLLRQASAHRLPELKLDKDHSSHTM